MATSLYDLSVPTFLQTVSAVGGFLDRAATHCAETGADPDDFVNARLFDDMAPFHFQIECVAHHSVWALEAVKKGVFAPPALIGPIPFANLQAMIAEAEAALKAFAPDEVNGWSGKNLDFQIGPRRLAFTSETFLLSFSLPNFYFHAVTAYDILRTQGVPLGKRDYEGQLRTGRPRPGPVGLPGVRGVSGDGRRAYSSPHSTSASPLGTQGGRGRPLARKALMTPVKHSFVDTRGFRTHIAEAGRSSGPILLLLHGWPEFWAAWEPMFDRLGDRYRLIAPDFRGFGESGNPDKGRSDQAGPDVLADDIAALMKTLGITKAGFVGHDVGAYAMQRLAINHPDRVAGLFFFNCGTHGVGAGWRETRQVNEIWYQTFHQMPFAPELVGASRDTCRTYFRHFLTHWSYRKDAFDGVLERWVDNFLRPGNLQGGFNWYVSQNAGRLAVMSGKAPRPPKIKQPTRVFWGRHDPVLRSDWIKFVPDYFEDVEANIAEDAGHFVHYETPDAAAAEIDRFFKRIGYA